MNCSWSCSATLPAGSSLLRKASLSQTCRGRGCRSIKLFSTAMTALRSHDKANSRRDCLIFAGIGNRIRVDLLFVLCFQAEEQEALYTVIPPLLRCGRGEGFFTMILKAGIMLLEEATPLCIQTLRPCIYELCRAESLRSCICQPIPAIVARCPVRRLLTNIFSEVNLQCIEGSLVVHKMQRAQYHIFRLPGHGRIRVLTVSPGHRSIAANSAPSHNALYILALVYLNPPSGLICV